MHSSPIQTPETAEAGNQIPPGGPPARWWTAVRYRVWQFWRSVTPYQLDDDDHAILESTLPPQGEILFTAMARNDQRHSLMVYRALRERGCTDTETLAAALLHDSGKGSGRVRLWVRPAVVLIHTSMPRVLFWLARDDYSWWRRPFYYAWHHAEVGADLAAAGGLSERTVLLIRTHHQPDGPAAEIHAVDDEL